MSSERFLFASPYLLTLLLGCFSIADASPTLERYAIDHGIATTCSYERTAACRVPDRQSPA